MTRAEIIAALQAALESRESALIVWERVKPAVREAIAMLVSHIETSVDPHLTSVVARESDAPRNLCIGNPMPPPYAFFEGPQLPSSDQDKVQD